MKTVTTTKKIYLHADSFDKDILNIYYSDMSEYGDILIATKEVELSFDVPEDYDVVQLEIDQLTKAKKVIQAENHLKVQNIEDQIQRLLAIGHDVGVCKADGAFETIADEEGKQ